MFARRTRRRDDRTASRRPRRAALGLESLEGRRLMTASAVLDGSVLRIQGTVASDLVSVSPDANGSTLRVTTEIGSNLLDYTFQFFQASRVTSITFEGGYGNDAFSNGTMKPSFASGGPGRDTLVGGSAADTLLGGEGDDRVLGNGGDDILQGNDGRDVLYGGAGWDRLDGGLEADFLDTGSAATEGITNAGQDFNASVPVVGGTTIADVNQRMTPTCSFLASLQGLAFNGVDLASRITYRGNGEYRVGLFSAPGVPWSITVKFEGDVDLNRDPEPSGNEFWTVLYQRAYVQMMGRESTDSGEALLALTGRNARFFTALNLDFFDQNFTEIQRALQQRKTVTAGTTYALVPNPSLVGGTFAGHAYTVIGAFTSNGTKFVTLRNPWGIDGPAPTGDAGDGIITLRFSDFKLSIGRMWIEA